MERVIDRINHKNKIERLKGLACKFKDFIFHLNDLQVHFTKVPLECRKCGGRFERRYDDIKRPKIKTLVCDCCGFRKPRKSRKTKKECLHCGSSFSHNPTNKFCSTKCSSEAQKAETIRQWKSGELRAFRELADSIRNYLFQKFDHKCVECGCDKVNPYSGKTVLQIEHIDGNPYNNNEENLTVLCPTCHAMTPTYGGLNKGSGRTLRLRKSPE